MLYIILPVYNEKRNIGTLLTDLSRTLKRIPHRIIAVNDGSTDGTLAILMKRRDKGLLVESYRRNMNVGAVFATGIDRALAMARDTDTIIIMESDRTSTPSMIPGMLREIGKGSDIVIASRHIPGGGYRHFPPARSVFSFAANAAMRQLFPIPGVRDYTIFFRAYRVSAIRKAVAHFGRFGLIQSRGFVANAELLVKLSAFTSRITEIPFMYDYGKKSGKTKIHVLKTITEYARVIPYLKACMSDAPGAVRE